MTFKKIALHLYLLNCNHPDCIGNYAKQKFCFSPEPCLTDMFLHDSMKTEAGGP